MSKLTFILFTLFFSCLLIACQNATTPDQSSPPLAATDVVPAATAVATEPTTPAEPTAVPATSEVSATAVSPTSPPTSSAPPTDEPSDPQPAREWQSSEISLPMADGLEIAGTLTVPESGDPVPAILLLHMLGSNQNAWSASDLLSTLNEQGYGTLTIDMRGHGLSGGSQDWPLAETDLQAVWQHLRDHPAVDGQATAVIGASIGANLALRLAANNSQIDTAVLLSPGFDYLDVTTDTALVNYGERPLFFAAANGDNYAAGTSRALFAQFPGPKQIEMFEGAAHGTALLTAEPTLGETITQWLDTHVATGDPLAMASEGGQAISIARADGILLDATRFGDGPQAVVFANMNDNDPLPWTETAELLAEAGYTAVTFRYRGSGNSLTDQRDDDLIAAVQFAAEQGAEEIVVIGASIGGAAAIKTVAAEPDLPFKGLIVIAAPSSMGNEEITEVELAALQLPQLYITAEDDRFGQNMSVERLYEAAPEPKTWFTVPGTAHGVEIFATEEGPTLQMALFDFITENMPH